MDEYYLVDRNILEYLFVSYNCFNTHCPGKIVVSLDTLRRDIRTRCPICKRECTMSLQKDWLEIVHQRFEYVHRQLRALELLPLGFSTAISPKTVFLDSTQPSNTQFNLFDPLSNSK